MAASLTTLHYIQAVAGIRVLKTISSSSRSAEDKLSYKDPVKVRELRDSLLSGHKQSDTAADGSLSGQKLKSTKRDAADELVRRTSALQNTPARRQTREVHHDGEQRLGLERDEAQSEKEASAPTSQQPASVQFGSLSRPIQRSRPSKESVEVDIQLRIKKSDMLSFRRRAVSQKGQEKLPGRQSQGGTVASEQQPGTGLHHRQSEPGGARASFGRDLRKQHLPMRQLGAADVAECRLDVRGWAVLERASGELLGHVSELVQVSSAGPPEEDTWQPPEEPPLSTHSDPFQPNPSIPAPVPESGLGLGLGLVAGLGQGLGQAGRVTGHMLRVVGPPLSLDSLKLPKQRSQFGSLEAPPPAEAHALPGGGQGTGGGGPGAGAGAAAAAAPAVVGAAKEEAEAEEEEEEEEELGPVAEFLIPVVDAILVGINHQKKCLVIEPPPGLLELGRRRQLLEALRPRILAFIREQPLHLLSRPRSRKPLRLVVEPHMAHPPGDSWQSSNPSPAALLHSTVSTSCLRLTV
eukprot:jgi/Mesen1/591/ME001074S10756